MILLRLILIFFYIVHASIYSMSEDYEKEYQEYMQSTYPMYEEEIKKIILAKQEPKKVQKNIELKARLFPEINIYKRDRSEPVVLLKGECKTGRSNSDYILRCVYDQIWYKSKYKSILMHCIENNFNPQITVFQRNSLKTIFLNDLRDDQEWGDKMLKYGGIYFPKHNLIVAGTQDPIAAYLK